MKWTEGRLGSGYYKLKLIGLSFFDLYILKFEEGSYITEHIDVVSNNKRHYRLNIVVKQAKEGGEFMCKEAFKNSKRIKFFRPDIHKHSVTKVVKGIRYVVSIGLCI